MLALFAGGQSGKTAASSAAAALQANTQLFLPIVASQERWDPPQVLTHLALPGAQCPNAVVSNPHSGLTYIINNESDDVSVLNGASFVTSVPTGRWPTLGANVPNSNRTYVTNLHVGTSLLEGTTVVGLIPAQYEPYTVVVNPVNGYAYIADLDSAVRVVNGLDIVADINLLQPDQGFTGGWLRSIVVDDITGRVYVASWEKGLMYIIEDTQVVEQPVRLGWGILNMVIDTQRGYLYAAHADPNAEYPHNLSVYSLATGTVTPISTAVRSREITLDPISGYVYATNPDNNSVTVLNGPQVVATLPVGERPWGIAASPRSGYVFVANTDSDNITVLRNGQVVSSHAAGMQPWAVGVDPQTNLAYIANRTFEITTNEFGQTIAICHPPTVTIMR